MTDTDAFLKPVTLYSDPFLGNNNKLVLSEVVDYHGKPHKTNTRHSCVEVMDAVQKEFDPWFGIEQEYMLIESKSYPGSHPFGWPVNGFPAVIPKRYPSFCGIGANVVYGRDVCEAHYRACLYAGVNISGTNAEGIPSQWEYQVGPSSGICVSDDLWMSRYILLRVAEDFNIGVSFDPKPISNWIGSSCHTNVSTIQTRTKGSGIKAIEEAMAKMSMKHKEHLEAYDPKQGKDNERRLKEALVAPSLTEFSFGVADRTVSVRIPRNVAEDGFGYFEDRRPSSNCDPYSLCERIVRTICLNQ